MKHRFEKFQSAILGSSSPDSVAIFEKKVGKTFSWGFYVFLSQPKKWIFDQNRINFTKMMKTLRKLRKQHWFEKVIEVVAIPLLK